MLVFWATGYHTKLEYIACGYFSVVSKYINLLKKVVSSVLDIIITSCMLKVTISLTIICIDTWQVLLLSGGVLD